MNVFFFLIKKSSGDSDDSLLIGIYTNCETLHSRIDDEFTNRTLSVLSFIILTTNSINMEEDIF